MLCFLSILPVYVPMEYPGALKYHLTVDDDVFINLFCLRLTTSLLCGSYTFIVVFELLQHYSEAKWRAPTYSQALHLLSGFCPECSAKEARDQLPHPSFS